MFERFVLLLKYLLLAIIQGIGEILPISSSGHMIIYKNILQINKTNLTIEIFLHFASLIAILIFFNKKITKLIKSFFMYTFFKSKRTNHEIKHNFKLSVMIIIATIPAGLVGILFNDYIEKYLSKMWIVGLMLIITSILLFISSKISRQKNLSYLDAFIMGLFQCIGIIPGISRSGSCLCGGAIRKVKQEEVAEFTFLMAIPMMIGSLIFKIKDISILFQDNSMLLIYIASFLTTIFFTFISLKIFFKAIKKKANNIFIYYCLLSGIIFYYLGIYYFH